MSAKLKEHIVLELQQLDQLLSTYPDLLQRCLQQEPTPEEVMAIGALLQSFYMGVENIFKRVLSASVREQEMGASWHVALLQAMVQPGGGLPAVISQDLRHRLLEYLGFRHVFIHTYSYVLDWGKMRHLVAGLQDTFQQLRDELSHFLAQLPDA